MIHDASDHGVSKEPMNPLQTALEKFENIALFLQLGLPSTLIRHENGTFPTSKRRNLKTPALSFNLWTENSLKTEVFEIDDVTINR